MGHQSYVVPFDTEEQLELILEILKKHNSGCCFPEFVRYSANGPGGEPVEFKQLEVGEELENVTTRAFKQGTAFKCPRNGPSLANVLLFSNGGGRGSTFAFLRWELMRALPNVFVDGFHAIGVYDYEESLEGKLVRAPNVSLDDRVKGSYDETLECAVRPATFTTRASVPNPEFAAKDRKKRVREQRDLSPYLSTYESVVDGFVVADRRYKEAARDAAEEYSNEQLERIAERDAQAEDEISRNLGRYKEWRAAGKRYFVVRGKRGVAESKNGSFWLTEAERLELVAAPWFESCEEAKVRGLDWVTEMSIDEVDAKLAAGEDVALRSV